MEKFEWERKLIVLMLFVFNWPKFFGVRIERNASGDVFEKRYYSLGGDSLEVEDCDDVGGTGSARPVSSLNTTHCQCGSGQTFYFDIANEEPKCMKQYGQSSTDLGKVVFE